MINNNSIQTSSNDIKFVGNRLKESNWGFLATMSMSLNFWCFGQRRNVYKQIRFCWIKRLFVDVWKITCLMNYY